MKVSDPAHQRRQEPKPADESDIAGHARSKEIEADGRYAGDKANAEYHTLTGERQYNASRYKGCNHQITGRNMGEGRPFAGDAAAEGVDYRCHGNLNDSRRGEGAGSTGNLKDLPVDVIHLFDHAVNFKLPQVLRRGVPPVVVRLVIR